jgi:parallel beta-helix repeat protein
MAESNGGSGFLAYSGATLSNCTARNNSGDGILVITGGSATACTALFNDASGISLGEGSSAIGCTSHANDGDGIKTTSSGYIARCNADDNVLAGVHATQGSNRIEGNKVTNNNAHGIKVDGTVNLIYGNTARGNGSGNYSIITGNRVGTIVIPPVSGTVTGNAGAAGFNSTDPWANIAF